MLHILHNMYTCTYIKDVSKRGVLDRRMTILHFLCIFCFFFFLIYTFLCWSWECFVANTCIFYISKIRYCIFLHIMTLCIVHGKIWLQFTCKFCKFAVHGRHGTVENASMVTSKNGIIHRQCCIFVIFCHFLLIMFLFCWSWASFFGQIPVYSAFLK